MFNKGSKDLNDEFQNSGKSRLTSYFVLFGLSILSALALLSLWVIMFIFRPADPNSYAEVEMGGSTLYKMMLIIAAQNLLIGPATVVVALTFGKLVKQAKLRDINSIVQVALPVMCNILAANAFFIYYIVIAPLCGYIFASLVSPQVAVTIQNESVTEWDADRSIYHATLHIENNSGQEIYLFVNLLDDTAAVGQKFYSSDHTLADGISSGEGLMLIPVGASERTIDMTLWSGWFCKNDVLIRPLYLAYKIAGDRNPGWSSEQINGILPVDPKMNQQIQRVCTPTP